MPTKLAIVYGAVSGGLRYVVAPDSDDELDRVHAKRLLPGEAMLTVDLDSVRVGKDGVSDSAIRAALEKYTGKPIPDPRCVVLDALGTVESVVCADPAIDAVSGKTLMLSANALPGWKLVAGALVSPSIVAQAKR